MKMTLSRLAIATAALVGVLIGGSGGESGALPTSPTTSTCGGAPQGVPGTWQCSFDEEFNGTNLNTHVWTVQQTSNSGFHSGQECFVNSPNNVSVSGGTLNLTVRQEAKPFLCQAPLGLLPYVTSYTSGMVSTYKTFSQAYGVFEVRAEIPAATVQGLQESFWLYPAKVNGTQGPLSTNGEIDIAEMYSEFPNLAIPTMHNNPFLLHPNATNFHCTISNPGTQFHTYGLVWTPTSMTIDYDGQTCLVDNFAAQSILTMKEPFNQPYMISLTQVLGIGTNQFEPGRTPLPATTHVDWVHVWR